MRSIQDQTTATFTGDTFSSNGVTVGESTGLNGLEFLSGYSGTAVVSGNSFLNNTANGIYVGGSASNIQIAGNQFQGNVGGIFLDSTLSPVNATVQGNTFTGQPASPSDLPIGDRRGRRRPHGDHRRQWQRREHHQRITSTATTSTRCRCQWQLAQPHDPDQYLHIQRDAHPTVPGDPLCLIDALGRHACDPESLPDAPGRSPGWMQPTNCQHLASLGCIRPITVHPVSGDRLYDLTPW